MTADELRQILRQGVKEAGSGREYARRHDISSSYINKVLNGEKEPGAKLCRILNVEKVIDYRPIK